MAGEHIVDPDGINYVALDADEISDAVAEEMIAVFRATFGRWPFLDPGVPALDHVRWKTSGPATRVGSIQARVDGRLAFATTSWAWWMRIEGRRLRRMIYPDTSIDPVYQGRRIYSRSVELRSRLVRETYDLSLHERGSSRRNERPLGRRGQTLLAARTTVWYRILRPLPWSRERSRSGLSMLAGPAFVLGALRAAPRRRVVRQRGLAVRDERGFDRRFDVLFEEAAAAFDVIDERTEEMLGWRYGDRRAGPFVVRSVSAGDRLLGYAVLRLAGARAYLADLLAVPDRLDVVEALVTDAVATARAAGAYGVETWLSRSHPYREALRRQGFFDARTDVGLQYHPVAASHDDLRILRDPAARVHFQLGDTDLV